MTALLELRSLSPDEAHDLPALAQAQKIEARIRDRAHICWLAHQGQRVAEISAIVGVGQRTVSPAKPPIRSARWSRRA